MDIPARKPKIGTLVYVSNGSWRGYGYFNTWDTTDTNNIKVKIDAAICNDWKSDYDALNGAQHVIKSVYVQKVKFVTTATSVEKSNYLSSLIDISRWNDTHKRDI